MSSLSSLVQSAPGGPVFESGPVCPACGGSTYPLAPGGLVCSACSPIPPVAAVAASVGLPASPPAARPGAPSGRLCVRRSARSASGWVACVRFPSALELGPYAALWARYLPAACCGVRIRSVAGDLAFSVPVTARSVAGWVDAEVAPGE